MAPNFADNIQQIRQETGARLVALGEEHTTANTVQYMRESLPALKKAGISTLYIEVPSDNQPLLDKALRGDEGSQRELRLKYEHWFGGYAGSEPAQQRYDLLFEANKAGIRVKCADADSFNDSIQKYIALDKGEQFRENHDDDMRARLAISNPVFARNIKQMDDGKGAILMIGLGHTFRRGEADHVEFMGEEQAKFYNSAVGGVDQQLNDIGIVTASADFRRREVDGFTLQKTEAGNSADYYIGTPPENRAGTEPSEMTTAKYRVSWDRMATLFERASIQAEAEGKPKDAKLCQDVSDKIKTLPQLLDNPLFLKQPKEMQQKILGQELDNVRNKIEKNSEGIPRLFEAQAASRMYSRWALAGLDEKTRNSEITAIIDTNQDLHLSGASGMWKRDPAPLAGEKNGLGKNFEQALSANVPLDRPQPATQPTPQIAANGPLIRNYER